MKPLPDSRPDITLSLPAWVAAFCRDAAAEFASREDRMRFVIRLAGHNVEAATGGPFAAAVFDTDTGQLIAPGVNLVETVQLSFAHAEIVALSLAQRRLGVYDLGGSGLPRCELVTSAEPCAMCLGAVPWSGVRSLVCGARHEDVCAIGMDEGAKPSDWAGALAARGITVTRDVLRDEAVRVLRAYRNRGGKIYNGRQGAPDRDRNPISNPNRS